ncbi:PKD domain-containing protein [Frankia sp. CNm7]|uniref:PKD domain-containing protein n=1 Tax=Frankia nepalensis TaxID=1836974 RepID=A0A937UW14_9ACTN|nr:effector-associated domain EAD1-containing protein [Frankia nepalensis]MBL7502671.1 PKD domain-containing protein [Frankia nepalensis]MBL7514935.1 PKD domain-containing protein [Frankia nepalensis]MBL7524260.1 PKD domain-containing protein [Frankia nepalensis]MBL7632896.1 PKD domain-containing protein [Frankia nepalensis]
MAGENHTGSMGDRPPPTPVATGGGEDRRRTAKDTGASNRDAGASSSHEGLALLVADGATDPTTGDRRDQAAGRGFTPTEITALAEAFPNASAASHLLRSVGFPPSRIPDWHVSDATEFWSEVGKRVADGVLLDGRARILAAAHARYPANRGFLLGDGGHRQRAGARASRSEGFLARVPRGLRDVRQSAVTALAVVVVVVALVAAVWTFSAHGNDAPPASTPQASATPAPAVTMTPPTPGPTTIPHPGPGVVPDRVGPDTRTTIESPTPTDGGHKPTRPPTAGLTVSPASGDAPLTVTADGSGSTPGSNPLAGYRFSVGDDVRTPADGQASVTYEFSVAGTYVVSLTVTDSAGTASAPVTASVTVTGPPSMTAPALVSPPDKTVYTVPDTVTFGWNAVPGASGYRLETEATDGENWQPNETFDVADTSMRYSWPGWQKFRWRVSALAPDGTQGPPSEWRELYNNPS